MVLWVLVMPQAVALAVVWVNLALRLLVLALVVKAMRVV
jgi:hypothetical protein